MNLISFDIDGTMFFGDPPGAVTQDLVRRAKALGYLVCSASDRTVSNQWDLWRENNIEIDFVVLKHQLAALKEKFSADRYCHIGDGEMDKFFAIQAGFDFYHVESLPDDGDPEWLS